MKPYKFPLDGPGVNTVSVPKGAKPMCFAIDPQTNHPAVWVLGDSMNDLVESKFQVCGTGMEVEPGAEYVGTLIAGQYVYHLFHLVQSQ